MTQITAFGETKSMLAWTKDNRCVVNYTTLIYRIKNGWNPEDAVSFLYISKKQKNIEQINKKTLLECLTDTDGVCQSAKKLNISVPTLRKLAKKFNIDLKNFYKDSIVDIKGCVFGFLTVLESVGKYKDGTLIWKCQCECGNIITTKSSSLRNGTKHKCKRICGGKNSQYNRDLYGYAFKFIEKRAKKLNKEFNITYDYICDLWEKQNKKCALSGVPLTLPSTFNEWKNWIHTASLDRIDSSKGYIKGNVQWIHKELQRIKMNLSEEILINWCHLISDYQRNNI